MVVKNHHCFRCQTKLTEYERTELSGYCASCASSMGLPTDSEEEHGDFIDAIYKEVENSFETTDEAMGWLVDVYTESELGDLIDDYTKTNLFCDLYCDLYGRLVTNKKCLTNIFIKRHSACMSCDTMDGEIIDLANTALMEAKNYLPIVNTEDTKDEDSDTIICSFGDKDEVSQDNIHKDSIIGRQFNIHNIEDMLYFTNRLCPMFCQFYRHGCLAGDINRLSVTCAHWWNKLGLRLFATYGKLFERGYGTDFPINSTVIYAAIQGANNPLFSWDENKSIITPTKPTITFYRSSNDANAA